MSKDTSINPRARVKRDRVLAVVKAAGAMPEDPAAAASLRDQIGNIIETGSAKEIPEDAAVVRRLRAIGCAVKLDAVESLGFGYTPDTRRSFTLTPDAILFNSESAKRTKFELDVADDIRRVLAAVNQKPIMRFVYTGPDGQSRARNVVPVRLYEGVIPNAEGMRWLLEAFDLDEGELRSYDIRTIAFGSDSVGAESIRVERERQKSVKGWDAKHDDAYLEDELVRAAACYALHGSRAFARIGSRDAWPWDPEWDKRDRHPKLRRLAIAGALIAAAIDSEVRRMESAKQGGS